MPSTGIPQTYEATFGPTGGENPAGHRVVRRVGRQRRGHRHRPRWWLDSGDGHRPVRKRQHHVGHLGIAYSLPVSDQVTYIAYPTGDALTVGPTETYGTNLATPSDGATASATSGNASAAISGSTTSGWAGAPPQGTPPQPDRHPGRLTDHQPDRGRHPLARQHGRRPARLHRLGRRALGTGGRHVDDVTDQYRDHEMLLAFDPVVATAVASTSPRSISAATTGGGPALLVAPPTSSPPSCTPSRSTAGPTTQPDHRVRPDPADLRWLGSPTDHDDNDDHHHDHHDDHDDHYGTIDHHHRAADDHDDHRSTTTTTTTDSARPTTTTAPRPRRTVFHHDHDDHRTVFHHDHDDHRTVPDDDYDDHRTATSPLHGANRGQQSHVDDFPLRRLLADHR